MLGRLLLIRNVKHALSWFSTSLFAPSHPCSAACLWEAFKNMSCFFATLSTFRIASFSYDLVPWVDSTKMDKHSLLGILFDWLICEPCLSISTLPRIESQRIWIFSSGEHPIGQLIYPRYSGHSLSGERRKTQHIVPLWWESNAGSFPVFRYDDYINWIVKNSNWYFCSQCCFSGQALGNRMKK